MAGGAPQPTSDSKQTTPEQKQPKHGEGFTGEDLAKLVTISDDLHKVNKGDTLNDVELEKILADRISGKNEKTLTVGDDTWDRARDLAEVIVDALPPALHTGSVVTALDLRPYLQQLDGKKIIFRSSAGLLLPDVTRHKTVSTKKFLEQAGTKVKEDAIVAGNGERDIDTSFSSGAAGVSPGAIDPTTGEFALSDSADDVQFPVEDMRAMVSSDEWDLSRLAQEDLEAQAKGTPGFFPVDVNQTMQHGPRGGALHETTETLGIVPAMNYLTTLPPSEVKKMQDKLAAGGYFDRVGKGGSFYPGDPLDENTVAAWKLLLTDSVKANVPASKMLGRNIATYRDQVRQERLKALDPLDPRMIQSMANDLGQRMIGRDLRPDEIEHVLSSIKALREARAGAIMGDESSNARGRLPDSPQGYTQDDVQLQLESTTKLKDEQRMNNQNALAYKLRQLMN